jgi:hypothetical protein
MIKFRFSANIGFNTLYLKFGLKRFVLLNLYQLAKRIGILNESNKSGDFAVGE